MKNLFLGIVWSFFVLVGASAQANDDIKVGWIGPLSGDAAVLGVDSVEVAKSNFKDINDAGGINGHKIKLIVEDDQYQTAKTITAYKKLVNFDGVKVIFILTYGGMLALADQAEKDNVILIDTLDCDDQLAALPKNSFCITGKTEDLATNNALHAIKHKNDAVGIIYAEGDPFMPKVAKLTKGTLEKGGVQVSLFEGVSRDTRDFRSLLLKIKQKNITSIFFYGYDNFGLGMKQARGLGIQARFYGLGNLNSPSFIATAGDALNGTIIATWFAPKSEAYDSFMSQYKSKMGREPLLQIVTIPTYDVTKILALGFEKAADAKDGTLNINKLRDYLYSVKNYEGLSGKITIEPDGTSQSFVIQEYSFNNGKLNLAD